MINDDIGINKFLNDLYEAIDENYAEALENNDELAIVRAKTELDLITKLLDGLDKIWLDNWSERMKVKELTEILQKHNPNREIIFLSGNKIYTVKSDDPNGMITVFTQKYLENIAVMHLKREL